MGAHLALVMPPMKVLMVLVALNSAIDRPAVAKLLNLALAETKPPPLKAASSLPVTLLGTLVDRRGLCSAALVFDSARAHTVYLGDSVAGATVVTIERDCVVLERDGQSFELRTHPLPLPSSSPPGGVHVSYAEI